VELLAVTHTGMTTGEFADTVRSWIETARHPISKRPCQMVYQPCSNCSTTFAPAASRRSSCRVAAEFMRPWVERV
jgi:hypothetical protein